jgi:hypothetical protein
MRRLLRCGSLAEAVIEAAVIEGEIAAVRAAGKKPFAKAVTEEMILGMIPR